jgi:hypothetical protein
MALPSDVTARTIGPTFSAANNLYVDVVVPGWLVWNDGATNHLLDLGAGGGLPGPTGPISCAGIVQVVSFTGSADGIWTD